MGVYFWLRESDHRTRIVFKIHHRTRPSEYYCLPLNMLVIVRQGPSLVDLCRRRHSGTQLVVWATLKFGTIESERFASLVACRIIDIMISRHGDVLLCILGSSLSRFGPTRGKHSRLGART